MRTRPRTQVEGVQQERLRPAASPTDPFVVTNKGAGLAQVADALSSLAPTLNRFSNNVYEKKKEERLLEAEKIARQAQQDNKSIQQMIDEGVMKPHESSWFQIGLSESFGRSLAADYAKATEVASK
jgi:hypothetical protein